MFAKFTVQDAPLSIQPGAIVKLTADQACRRRHVITAGKGRDVYVAAQEFQFKVGEVVEIDLASTNLPLKTIAGIPERVIAVVNKERAEAKAEAEVKAAAAELAAAEATAKTAQVAAAAAAAKAAPAVAE